MNLMSLDHDMFFVFVISEKYSKSRLSDRPDQR